MYRIRKYVKVNPSFCKERLIIKTFKHQDDMHKFLTAGDNALQWKEVKEGDYCGFNIAPTKAGTYAFAGGQWHNVKSLDASILAHI